VLNPFELFLDLLEETVRVIVGTDQSLSAADRRRRDGVTTPPGVTVPGVVYRMNRSSRGWFAGTALRTPRAVQTARVNISQNSENGHHQRWRPPRRGAATYLQWRYRQTFCSRRLTTNNRSRSPASRELVVARLWLANR
jgi:hypothetical protein